MIKKIKQTRLEKYLTLFIIILAFLSFGSLFILKNNCLFVKNYDPTKITFKNPSNYDPSNLVFEKIENIAVLNVPCGNVIIELYPKLSPNSVKRFKMLIETGEYNDVAFHRVIKKFLVQAGDLEYGKRNNVNYTYLGTGSSKYGNIKSELNKPFSFVRGSVGMARKSEMDSEDSQFFILLKDAPLFEGEYTPVGKVLYGLKALEKIKHNNKSEYVLRPDFINHFKMLKDL